jgi:hypothetical protein
LGPDHSRRALALPDEPGRREVEFMAVSIKEEMSGGSSITATERPIMNHPRAIRKARPQDF